MQAFYFLLFLTTFLFFHSVTTTGNESPHVFGGDGLRWLLSFHVIEGENYRPICESHDPEIVLVREIDLQGLDDRHGAGYFSTRTEIGVIAGFQRKSG